MKRKTKSTFGDCTEKENFYRHSTVIVDIIGNAFTKLLEHYLEQQGTDGITLRKFVSDSRHRIYHLYDVKHPCCLCPIGTPFHKIGYKVLYREQMEVLFGDNSSASHCKRFCCAPVNTKLKLKDLDVTLASILLLLTNILPPGSAEKHAFECLREKRNKEFAHVRKGRMSIDEYESSMTEIERNLMILAKKYGEETEVQNEMNCVRKQPFNTELYSKLQETLKAHSEQMEKMSDQVEQNLAESKKTQAEYAKEIGEMKEQINNFTARFEAFVTQHGPFSNKLENKKRISTLRIDTNNANIDEVKTVDNLVRRSRRDPHASRFAIEGCWQLCIFLNLSYTPEVLQSEESLKMAIRELLADVIDAGEIDTQQPGEIQCSISFNGPLTDNELRVLQSVFQKSAPNEQKEREEVIMVSDEDLDDSTIGTEVRQHDSEVSTEAKCELCLKKDKQITEITEEIKYLEKEVLYLMEDNQILRKNLQDSAHHSLSVKAKSSTEETTKADQESTQSSLSPKTKAFTEETKDEPSKESTQSSLSPKTKAFTEETKDKPSKVDRKRQIQETPKVLLQKGLPSKKRKFLPKSSVDKDEKGHLYMTKIMDDLLKDVMTLGQTGQGTIDRGNKKFIRWSYKGILKGFQWMWFALCKDEDTGIECEAIKHSRTGAVECAMRELFKKLQPLMTVQQDLPDCKSSGEPDELNQFADISNMLILNSKLKKE